MLLIFIWGQMRKSFWQSVCTKAGCLWTLIYPKWSSQWMKVKQAGSGLILSGRHGAGSAADADDGAHYRLCSPALVPEEGKASWTLWASKLSAPPAPPLKKESNKAIAAAKDFSRKRNGYGQAGCTTSPGQGSSCPQYQTSLHSEIQKEHTKRSLA